jgi:DNA polymerase I-like protein with 3'-5' exonuclease and polymerase domains
MHRAKHPAEKPVLLIVDYPIQNEVERDYPWSAASHLTLLSDLAKAGITQKSIHTTYLSYERPEKDSYDWGTEFKKKKNIPEGEEQFWFPIEHQKDLFVSTLLAVEVTALTEEIKKVNPKIIIVAGKWSYFFLSGNVAYSQTQGTGANQKPLGGLAKHRASIETTHESLGLNEIVLFPMLPAIVKQRSPDKIPVIKWDCLKVGDIFKSLEEGTKVVKDYLEPTREFILGTNFEEVISWLETLLAKLETERVLVSIDIETRYNAMIDCIGFAYTNESGICIPFSTLSNPNFWTLEEELAIYIAMTKVFKHKNLDITGQNFSYDQQYLLKFWLIPTKASVDTMVIHHTLYNNMQKDLAFLASIYCNNYRHWKDSQNGLDEERWVYNVKDVLYTREIAEVLMDVMSSQPQKLQDFYEFQQHQLSPAINRVMNRGIRLDLAKKEDLHRQLSEILKSVEDNLSYIIGETFNPKSTPQIKALFKDLLKVKAKINRKTGTESFGSEYMLEYLEQYPLFAPLIKLILEYRSIGIFVRTFLSAKVDEDGRIRTSYNVAGTKTYRLASRKNAFGNGLNCQNIPKEGKIDLKYSLASVDPKDDDEDAIEVIIDDSVVGITELPNCKSLFIPDEGYVFFDIDYSGADARVVAYDSNCKFLIDIFSDDSLDLYATIATEYYKRPITKKDKERQLFKAICHGTNYLGKAPTLAGKAGLLVAEVEKVQKFYFDACPEVRAWQNRHKNNVDKYGFVENVFGARGYFLDKGDANIYNKAIAFIPQSSIAILVNKGLVNIDTKENPKNVQVLLQTHDSLSGQYLKTDLKAADRITKHMMIPMQYQKELIIPAGIAISEKSYGDVK